MQVNDFTVEVFEEKIGPLKDYSKDCHRASLAVVKTKLFPKARVARGIAKGVGGQHSWVVIGDPYDVKATIIDPTLWSYRTDVKGIYVGNQQKYQHSPHGAGFFLQGNFPQRGSGKTIPLTGLSSAAKQFLKDVGLEDLDAQGWMMVANLPVQGWPAAEIIGALYKNNTTKAFVPVDRVGMLTDLNPGGLYF